MAAQRLTMKYIGQPKTTLFYSVGITDVNNNIFIVRKSCLRNVLQY